MADKTIEELTDEILGRIIKEIPKVKVSNSVEEAFEKALQDTTPERAGDPRRVKDTKGDDEGWLLP